MLVFFYICFVGYQWSWIIYNGVSVSNRDGMQSGESKFCYDEEKTQVNLFNPTCQLLSYLLISISWPIYCDILFSCPLPIFPFIVYLYITYMNIFKKWCFWCLMLVGIPRFFRLCLYGQNMVLNYIFSICIIYNFSIFFCFFFYHFILMYFIIDLWPLFYISFFLSEWFYARMRNAYETWLLYTC